jgi:hypothetical protein
VRSLLLFDKSLRRVLENWPGMREVYVRDRILDRKLPALLKIGTPNPLPILRHKLHSVHGRCVPIRSLR